MFIENKKNSVFQCKMVNVVHTKKTKCVRERDSDMKEKTRRKIIVSLHNIQLVQETYKSIELLFIKILFSLMSSLFHVLNVE